MKTLKALYNGFFILIALLALYTLLALVGLGVGAILRP